MKTALITGVTGQDGSYLAEFLLEKGYTVHGVASSSSFNTARIDHLFNGHYADEGRFFLHHSDMMTHRVCSYHSKVEPSEIYNLAAQSHVAVSFASQNTLQTQMLWERLEYLKQ